MAEDSTQTPAEAALIGGDASTELSSNRTAMSFERTAMSSDRTLMSSVRTSLSMIGFGFTIFQLLRALHEKLEALPMHAPRNFGLALIVLGVVLLVLGIGNHIHETRARRRRRKMLVDAGLIRHPEINKASSTLVIAFLLLVLGLLALLRVGFSVGPF